MVTDSRIEDEVESRRWQGRISTATGYSKTGLIFMPAILEYYTPQDIPSWCDVQTGEVLGVTICVHR